MDRRRFLLLSGLAALTSGVPLSARRLLAQQAMGTPTGGGTPPPYTGPFYIFVNAGGGWDPTMVCDPKGGDVDTLYMPSAIGHAGNLAYAPVNYMVNGSAYSNQTFFEKFQSRLLVVNGIDMATNNHDTGTRYTWSGYLEDGYPPLAGLIAAVNAPGTPLAFISNGGYEYTAGVAPLTRVDNLDTISRIAYPNRQDPNNAMSLYQSDATINRIHDYQQQRLSAMAGAQTLPRLNASMNQLLGTRTGSDLLARMMMFVPSQDDFNNAHNPILRQGMVALAAYQAGVSAAVNLNVGGFDTHSDHDNQQSNALGVLLQGVDQLMDRIDHLGLTSKVVVMIGSDFGRTPFYNAAHGKDHWSVTSVMMMGAGIGGNRVIGASDDGFRAKGIDPSSLSVVDDTTHKVTPAAIHRALRRFAMIDSAPLMTQFPIVGDDLALFG